MKHIVIAISKLYGGGAEKVATLWANSLVNVGYKVSLFVISRGVNEYSVSDKVEIVSVCDDLNEYLGLNIFQKFTVRRRLLQSIKPDVIISFLPNYQIQMRILSVGMRVRRIETVRVNPWRAGNSSFERSLWRMCFLLGDAAILQTNDQADFFGKSVKKKAVVIRNPIASEFIKDISYEYREKAINIIAAGRICEQKNYPLLLEAISIVKKEHSEVFVSIYGTGEQRYIESIKKKILELNLEKQVYLCGQTKNIKEKLLNADLFVMTSDFEGMPNSLAEAMSLGLVCISTDCKTGPKDMIKDGENGFLIPMGDANALAEKIINICDSDKEYRSSIGQKARKSVIAMCDQSKNLNLLINVIENRK